MYSDVIVLRELAGPTEEDEGQLVTIRQNEEHRVLGKYVGRVHARNQYYLYIVCCREEYRYQIFPSDC